VIQGSWKAQWRLHAVFAHMTGRGRPANVATVAGARGLAGFLWASATAD
jgi:hypothetical protein